MIYALSPLTIYACGKDEQSLEEKSGGGSIFTKRLLEAIRSKGDATDFLFEFTTLVKNGESDAQMKSGQNQTPEIQSTGKEALFLLAKPAAPRPISAPSGEGKLTLSSPGFFLRWQPESF